MTDRSVNGSADGRGDSGRSLPPSELDWSESGERGSAAVTTMRLLLSSFSGVGRRRLVGLDSGLDRGETVSCAGGRFSLALALAVVVAVEWLRGSSQLPLTIVTGFISDIDDFFRESDPDSGDVDRKSVV